MSSADVAKAIRIELARQNRTQTGLAIQLGMSPATLARRLKGRMTVDDVEAIAAALGVDPMALYGAAVIVP